MITKEIVVNDIKFKVMLTDQIINQVDNLKSLNASVANADPEDFEQISSEISATINEIATAVEPEVSGEYLDGVMQEVFKAVDDKKVLKTRHDIVLGTHKLLKTRNDIDFGKLGQKKFKKIFIKSIEATSSEVTNQNIKFIDMF